MKKEQKPVVRRQAALSFLYIYFNIWRLNVINKCILHIAYRARQRPPAQSAVFCCNLYSENPGHVGDKRRRSELQLLAVEGDLQLLRPGQRFQLVVQQVAVVREVVQNAACVRVNKADFAHLVAHAHHVGEAHV